MFKTIETTIITKTSDFDKAFDKFDKSFNDISEEFQNLAKSFSHADSNEVEKITSIEMYGDTKQKALDELNKLSIYGYKLESIEEDKNKGVWILRANK